MLPAKMPEEGAIVVCAVCWTALADETQQQLFGRMPVRLPPTEVLFRILNQGLGGDPNGVLKKGKTTTTLATFVNQSPRRLAVLCVVQSILAE
jgi:hypothetical protein